MNATNTDKAKKYLTPTEHRAAVNPGWTMVLTGLVSPAIFLVVYAIKQRSWAYMNILIVLLAVLVGSDAEGNQNRKLQLGAQLTAGAAAALVAQNNKKKAKKELGLVQDEETG